MNHRYRKLNEEQRKYVDRYHSHKWAKTIGQELGVSAHLVRVYMIEKGYPPRKDCRQNKAPAEPEEMDYFDVDQMKGEFTWVV